MVYMLMAFAWWALLLFTKNRDAFHAKRELMQIGMVAEGRIRSEADFEQMAEYQLLAKKYKRQEYMIFGEAMVFVLTLLAGIWFINQGYQKEVRANQQRRNFLLSITHELKSPIASIRLVLETLLRRKELPKDKSEQLTNSALRENERLHELVENLLLSAKLESAYQPFFEEINLAELVKDIIAKIAERNPNARIVLDVANGFPIVKMDKQGMISIVTNLLENAVKYANDRPEIEIRLRYKDGQVTLDFADNGIGIPDKEKKRIFEKFYRIGSEETRQTKGTGLGLFIVEQVVKAHKGHIQVLDNQPKGTIFRIVIRES
jgi:signal transduction histidine kinase